jgi:hypothetical protein
MFYSEGTTSKNFPFGKSDLDHVRFSVYDSEGVFVTSSIIHSTGTYQSVTQSYYDVLNQPTTYQYSQFYSDWVLVGSETKSLFLDVSKVFNSVGISDGNYKVCIELGRYVVGREYSQSEKLMVSEISADRTEISLIPKNLKGTESEINFEYDKFSNRLIDVKDVVEDLTSQLSSPQIYNAYYAEKSKDESGSMALKYYYGFGNRLVQNQQRINDYSVFSGRDGDVDIIAFISDIYYGVKKGNVRNNGQYSTNDILGIYDQFKNWLYQNYNV